MVKASDSRAAGMSSIPDFAVALFLGPVVPVTSELVVLWLNTRRLAL